MGQDDGDRLQWLILATLAVVLLQHAINLLNDVSDWKLGADSEKYDSWVRFHHYEPRIASIHGWISFVSGALLGLAMLILSGKLWILKFASPMLLLGYLYNSGPRPLSYTYLGEWVTGLCYGPGVFGCLWLLVNDKIDSAAVLGMAAFAALAVSLLLSHQPPQVETDRLSGKQSFAVRFGVECTQRAARLLFVCFLSCFGLALWMIKDLNVAAWVYSIGALPALVWVMRMPPKPPIILLPATLVIIASLIAREIVVL